MLAAALLNEIFALPPQMARAYVHVIRSIVAGTPIITTNRYTNKPYIVDASGKQYLFEQSPNMEGVLVLPINGEITREPEECGTGGTQALVNNIILGNKLDNIINFVLDVKSPGGTVDGTNIAAKAVRQSKKPILGFGKGVVGSAAYWIYSQAKEAYMETEIDRVGSIGTMFTIMDYQDYLKQQGINIHTIYATDSTEKNKDYYDILGGNYEDFRKNTLDPINQTFIGEVRQARPQIAPEALTGKIYFAKDALKVGLIDGIADFNTVINRAFELGSKTTKTTYYYEN